MIEYILLGVVLWAAGMVTYMLRENLQNTRRVQNALLVLTDKHAAVTAAGITRSETAPQLSAKQLAEKKKASKETVAHEKMMDEIEHMTTLTPEAEKYLSEQGLL